MLTQNINPEEEINHLQSLFPSLKSSTIQRLVKIAYLSRHRYEKESSNATYILTTDILVRVCNEMLKTTDHEKAIFKIHVLDDLKKISPSEHAVLKSYSDKVFPEIDDESETHDVNVLICPYCGYRHTDPFEMFSRDQECLDIECHSCENVFTAIHHITSTYIGKK